MNNLSGFNTQEMRRLHPYLTTLFRQLKSLEARVDAGTKIVWGKDEDIVPTGNENLAGYLSKFARADHQHLFKFPVAVPLATPDGTAFFDLSASAINIYVDNTPTTRVVAGATDDDVQPTGRRDTGTAPRYAFADHSHPTALLPQDDPQPPVEGEIRYDENDKLVRWDGTEWVPLSVEAGGGGGSIDWGTLADVQPTGARSAGTVDRVARADHSHPTALLPQSNSQTPVDNEIRYNANNKLVRWNGSAWVELSVETVEAGTDADIQPTRLRNAGSSSRFARSDHSHPTALLPQSDSQSPVVDEIRYNTDNKIVRWNGSEWVLLSVEAGASIDWGTDSDVQPTGLNSTGTAPRVARADHSHPTVILDEDDPQPPVENEIRFNAVNKLIRWDGITWVPLSVEALGAGTINEVQPTGQRSAGTIYAFSRADHSHPTVILPQNNSQTPVIDEIRYNSFLRLVRWNGTTWQQFTSALPVPADPLILPYDTEVSSPQDRQLVNRSAWDNIGNATVFYRDGNINQYRLIFARPLVVSTTSTPSGKNVWSGEADELVLKEGTGSFRGGVLWRRRGNTQDWSPVSVQLSDDGTSFPTDVGVLIRSALTGTSGSRRWFLRGAQEGGSFRAPFVGFATFTASTTPAPSALATNLGDGYAYYIQDLDRVDIVKPETDGNKYCTMLTHYLIAPPLIPQHTGGGTGDSVVSQLWEAMTAISFITTTASTIDSFFMLPTITIPLGIAGGRVLLYLHNPQSFPITTYFAVLVRTPTSTGRAEVFTPNTAINIPANRTIVADLGYISFSPSTTLSHYRSYPICITVVRRKHLETTNSNTVICRGVVIVPQRAS